MDTLPLVAPEQVGLSAQRLDRVRKWMNGWVDSGRLAGMVTAVMRQRRARLRRDLPARPTSSATSRCGPTPSSASIP